jgi:hypothetical protein
VLVAGDLNAEPGDPQIAAMRAAGFEELGFGVDYQMLRPAEEGWRAQAFVPLFDGRPVLGVPQPRVSDHVGLLGAYVASPVPV